MNGKGKLGRSTDYLFTVLVLVRVEKSWVVQYSIHTRVESSELPSEMLPCAASVAVLPYTAGPKFRHTACYATAHSFKFMEDFCAMQDSSFCPSRGGRLTSLDCALTGKSTQPYLLKAARSMVSVRMSASHDLAQPLRRKSDWRVLFSLCKSDWPLLLAASLMLTLAAFGEALIPQLQSQALNALLNCDAPRAREAIQLPLRRLASVGVLTSAFTGMRGFLFWLSGARLVKRLRASVFSSLLAQPQSFHDVRGTGELSSRLNADCVKLSDVLSLNINIIVRQIIQSVAGIAIVARLSGKLALMVLAGVSIRGALNYVYASLSKQLATEQQDALAESAAVAEQCLSLVQVVRSYGTREYEGARYQRKLEGLLAVQRAQGVI